MRQLILSAQDFIKKLALIEQGKVSEFLIDRENKKELSGNFYKGRIVDIVESIETVFIDIGLEKNAFLNIKKLKNGRKFNIGDEILVQIENDPRDEKGAKLTLDYSISGKNLVFLANSKKILLSNKIKNNKYIKKLEKIFSEKEKEGLIIRTTAVNVDEKILIEEYEKLYEKWQYIENLALKSKVGNLIYSQNTILDKLFREYFDDSIDELVVDNAEIYQLIKRYIDDNNLHSLKNKLKRYFKDEDIFDYYNISKDIDNALRKKVWLNSGAYIVVEKTEAFVSIDVNTGRNMSGKNWEECIFDTNLEAAAEIPRQLRLRNLAGIVIIDFIDMKKNQDKKKVLEILEENLKKDRMQTEIINFSSLNLVQLTRKRQGKELAYYFQESCPYCEGSSFIKSQEYVILEILKEIKKLAEDKDISKMEIMSDKNIIEILERDFSDYILKITKARKKELKFIISYEYLKDRYKINLYS